MLDPNRTPDEYADAYVHLLLTQEEAAAFEARCETDAECRRALDDARRRKELLESAPPAKASEQLVQATIERINGKVERRAHNWRVYSRTVIGLTTAAVALIAVCHFYFLNLRPTPYDLRILGQNELLSGGDAAIRVVVLNERTGIELEGVPVSLKIVDRDGGEAVELATFETSRHAAQQVKLPDWADGEYELRVVARPKGVTESLTRPLRLTRQWKLMLSSDKPLYQPGQTIHMRSLALRKPDLKPMKDEPMVFKVTDPKGNVIFLKHTKGSRFGIASADCQLANEILEGPYNIACIIGDVASEKTVKVEKYVLPKFSVGVTLDKPFYQPGESVSGAVQADYFFGQPVAGGEVKVEVRGADAKPFSIAAIDTKTNEKGRAEFRFTLPDKLFGSEKHSGNAQITAVATVTDTAGQLYSRGVQRFVTSQPIQLDVIPESGALVQGVNNKVYIFASYVDGRPAEVDITFNSKEKVRTNKLGVAEIEVNPTSESVGVTLVAEDQSGRVGRKHVTLTSGVVGGDFVVRTDRATYSGGETMALTALGGGVEPLFVDLLKDGQTMLTATVEMADGQGEQHVDLPPELFGTLKLVAYRFDKSGLAIRKTKTVFVRQVRQLNVAATLDKQQYRPGSSAKLNLKLTDDSGKPVVGAISLAAVDEAVFALLGQRPGMEEVFFLLEEELLEPVYAIYNWDPFAEGNLPPSDLIQLEQAIFSRTARVTGGEAAVPSAFSGPAVGARDQVVANNAMVDNVASDASPFTLAARSYQAKYDRIARQRSAGVQACVVAWWSLLAALLMVGWATALVYMPRVTIAVSSVSLVMLVIVGMMSAWRTVQYTMSEANFAMPADAIMADMAGAMAGAEGGLEEPGLGEADPSDQSSSSSSSPPRVRQWFPETLLWRPQIITDELGEAVVEIPLADSITSWRLTTSAVSTAGQLGGGQLPIRVFQPFFVDLDLPTALTRNDQVSVPVVAYNYLDEPQTVTLTLEAAKWFTRLDADGEELKDLEPLTLELGPREIRSLHIPLRIDHVGQQSLQVTAMGSGMSDAIRRKIDVVPDGRRVEQVVSGAARNPASVTLTLPAKHIEGSARAIVKLYPSTFSQLVEGLDAIFRMPSGCFEQTSSTTYPNVLALDYLRRTNLNAPEVEAKARQYIHTGYQRLVSFEVPGGGFDWFGNPPANQTLTAYGLMEFEDMERVYDVDPKPVERARSWLLSKRQADGRWKAEPNMLNDGLAGSVNRGEDLDLAATAYIAWAVFGYGHANAASDSQPTLDYLLAHEPASIESPYVLAVVANCIAGIDSGHKSLPDYFDRLDAMKKTNDDGSQVFWAQNEHEQTTFYGNGRSGDIETTAMATLALLKASKYPASVRGALAWLIAQKDGAGTWHSTQATVLALKALVESAGDSLGGEDPRTIELAIDNQIVRTVEIPADQSEVMQQINLTDLLVPGEQRLTITDRSDASTGFQVTQWHHVEEDLPAATSQPLSIDIDYDRERLKVDETVTATAAVTNNMTTVAPMVILDLPVPGGFKIERGELDELVGSNKIAKYQITARKAIVYLRELPPGQPLKLNYRLRATMPVKVTAPPAAVYEYYNPQKRGVSKPALLEATVEA